MCRSAGIANDRGHTELNEPSAGALAPVPAYQVPHGRPMARISSKDVLIDEQRQVPAGPAAPSCTACCVSDVAPDH